MPKLTPVLPSSKPDPAILDHLALAYRACLAMVAFLVAVCLAARLLIPQLAHIFPPAWQVMKTESALAALLCAVALELSRPRRPAPRLHILGLGCAILLVLFAADILFEYRFHPAFSLLALFPVTVRAPGTIEPLSAGAFFLLGLATCLIRTQSRLAGWLADLFSLSLGMLVLFLVFGYIFATMPMFGLPTQVTTQPQTLLCLLLLTTLVLLRRAPLGVLVIFLSRGIGGKTARIFTPILLLLPFLRESARAHIINTARMPHHYITALLASLAAGLSLCLLLYLVWRINAMEIEIHELSLRDELTGLYNLRGFRLLADQALRLAQRSSLPFSVLFIDVDSLKQINDALGHPAGSAFLVETADILKDAFRETDVLGRIGGDEFAVAGQFSKTAISIAADRLHQTSIQRNAAIREPFRLTFSVGSVTSEEDHWDSLDVLLAKADQAMYAEKRSKKLGPG